MSDRVIIKSIKKIYFTIVTFLIFIFLTFTTLFVLLQNGILIQKFSFANIHIKQLYIKWNEKIDLSIKELTIKKSDTATNSFDMRSLTSYMGQLKHSVEWFHSITIEKITFDEYSAAFGFKQNSPGTLKITSPSILFDAKLSHVASLLHLEVKEFIDKERKIAAQGDVFLDLAEDEFVSNIDLMINEDLNAILLTKLSSEKLTFKLKSHKDIQDIKYLVQLAKLDKEIQFWTQDAIDVESVTLTEARGVIDLNNPANSLKSIYVKAVANGLDYLYNTKLDAIHSKWTELEFKDGILYIYPKEAHSYATPLMQSWLKIDFSQKEEILTLQLLFDGALDSGMHTILKAYGIKIPFYQNSGSIATSLELKINLMTLDVDAQGEFFAKEANFDYHDLNIDVRDAHLVLENTLVKIDAMRALYKDIASADVKVLYDATKSEGFIDLEFDSIAYNNITLSSKQPKLNVRYALRADEDEISVEHSYWDIEGQTLEVNKLALPFDLEKQLFHLPTTFIKLDSTASALVGGTIDVKNTHLDLLMDLLTLNYQNISLSQSTTPIHIQYDERLEISSKEKIHFTFNGLESLIEKPKVIFKDDEIILRNSKLNIGNYLKTKLYAKHKRRDEKTHISLSDIVIQNPEDEKLFYQSKKVLLALQRTNKGLSLNSKEIGAKASLGTHGDWNVSLSSLNLLAQNSDYLNAMHLSKGEVYLSKKEMQKSINFHANLKYPYKILTKNAKPTDEYIIDGEFLDEKIKLTINDLTKISIDDAIEITTEKSTFNIHEVLRFTELFETQASPSKKIHFRAQNSSIYLSKSRKIISDTIDLQYADSILTAELLHADAKANLRLEENIFHLYGKGFNDKFMQELFYLSKFKGGRLDFSLSGTPKEYGGVAYIKESTILDYKLLNNVLAFINTVPSLVTFSLPGYSKNGIFAKEAYVKFRAKESHFDFSDIYLESKELSIIGNGAVDTQADTIDINLNLKTDLGSDASKIPLVGHILFDGESVSTTLQITGKLSDPKVQSLIAKEIIVAPLNIIKRTLSLPYDLLQDIGKKEK